MTASAPPDDAPHPSAGVDQRRATTTARGRLYHWKGEEFWSVTTLLKGLPAPQLQEWKVGRAIEVAINDRREIERILAGTRMERITKRVPAAIAHEIRSLFGLRDLGPRGGEGEADDIWIVRRDPDAIARAKAFVRSAIYTERDRKGDIGGAVHDEVEAYILGKPRPEPSLLVAKYIAQFRSFLDACHPEFLLAEANVYNRTEAYAGRLDGLVKFNGIVYLLDWKTGKDIYPEVAYQLAAYGHAEFVGMPDGSEIGMPFVQGAAALHLTETDWELVPVVYDDDTFRDFKYIRENFDILERRSKGVLGRPVKNAETLAFLAVGNAPTLSLLDGSVPAQVVELHPEADE